jgi:hypothetical protein
MTQPIGVVSRAGSRITGNRSLVRTAARRRVVARVVGDVASKSTRGDFFAAFRVVRRRRRAGAPPSASRDDAPQSLEAFEREMRRLREENPDGLLDDSEDDPEVDLESLDAPEIKGGGVLLRVVAFALAAWCHALAPLGGRWGAPAAASAKTATAVALFATPLQWFGVAFFLSAIASGGLARLLREAKAFQPIRAEGPAKHASSRTKTKTPTAGGVALVPAGCLAALIFTRAADPATNAVVVCTLLFLAIGFKDDLGKLRAKNNDAGLSPRVKLAAQVLVASAFVGVVAALSTAGRRAGEHHRDVRVRSGRCALGALLNRPSHGPQRYYKPGCFDGAFLLRVSRFRNRQRKQRGERRRRARRSRLRRFARSRSSRSAWCAWRAAEPN